MKDAFQINCWRNRNTYFRIYSLQVIHCFSVWCLCAWAKLSRYWQSIYNLYTSGLHAKIFHLEFIIEINLEVGGGCLFLIYGKILKTSNKKKKNFIMNVLISTWLKIFFFLSPVWKNYFFHFFFFSHLPSWSSCWPPPLSQSSFAGLLPLVSIPFCWPPPPLSSGPPCWPPPPPPICLLLTLCLFVLPISVCNSFTEHVLSLYQCIDFFYFIFFIFI